MGTDGFSARYGDLLTGSYDCVDRVVLNAYMTLCHSPGGFRVWWRRLYGDDEQLDNAHLMRLAGRFARRVRAFAAAHDIPVVDCGRGERKHLIAEEYLANHTVGRGVFLILVARAPATVWDVQHTSAGVIRNLGKKKAFVNHCSFHVMDPDWGHLTIKMSGHPPFAAQVILNGHEYVACQAQRVGVCYTKEGNCFTRVPDPVGLAQIADTLSLPGGCRAAGPGHRAVDLYRGVVFRPGSGRAGPFHLPVFLLGLPGGVLPQPAVPHRGGDGPGLQRGAGPNPVPAGHANAADLVRRQTTPR